MTDLDLRGKRVFIRADLNVPQDDGRDHRRHPHPRVGAGDRALPEGGRGGDGDLAPGAADRRRAQARGLAGADRRSGWPSCSAARCRWCATGSTAARARRPARWCCSRTAASTRARRRTTTRSRARWPKLCDIYVKDAFGTAHRAEATTHGMAKYAPVACAGPLLAAELDALGKALSNPARPLVAIVAGSKVSTKLTMLKSAGGQGRPADRRRRHRQHLISPRGAADRQVAGRARPGRRGARDHGHDARAAQVPLPVDVVVANELSAHARGQREGVEDVGPRRHDPRHRPADGRAARGDHRRGGHDRLERAGGRVRVRRSSRAARGARRGDRRIAARSRSPAAATRSRRSPNSASPSGSGYISTGGGAFLEFLEGRELPAVEVLEARAAG